MKESKTIYFVPKKTVLYQKDQLATNYKEHLVKAKGLAQ
ncbi:hypothetical protein DGI_2064 [Megalodesulfovibrio gigas DSM 1382 = ATCC 19364]|uniref:Uncharacterized protein n=1 Tax=Megalodesulfovibrio gigas (strain ATCC 19364 / DSM 1382 / NCIMB 9332 / VKM B-1759) TaxID=1121448 RepID=T2GBZ9_MEGG1|nr:hypothetical protein DGI_2064 [Megalodesulfovibrio gigas DSM 1382 = ATCC 19364]